MLLLAKDRVKTKTIFCLLLAHHLLTFLPRTCEVLTSSLVHADKWWHHCWTAHDWWHGLAAAHPSENSRE